MIYLGICLFKLEYNNEGYVVYELCLVGDINVELIRYKDEREFKVVINCFLNKMKELVKKNDVIK